ncbi:MAG TPA: hypothetical protein VHF27_07900 [Acidimicrobiales bacterium]|nr:hypothetical protein [Acidimicrobiales bacterium]
MGDVAIDRLTLRLPGGTPAGTARILGSLVGRGLAGAGFAGGSHGSGVAGTVRLRVRALPGESAERLAARIAAEIAAHVDGGR